MRACLIFNPAARGEKARHFRSELEGLQSRFVCRPTTGPGAARSLASAAVRENFELIVAAGGDGTLNEVLNGIGDEPEGFKRVRLGVLPLGTVNVFAKEIGMPRRLDQAWPIFASGREKWIDLGLVEAQVAGRREKRYFAQMAGAGLDARAIEMVDWNLKKKIGQLAYVIAGAKVLGQSFPPITLTHPGGQIEAELVVVGNGRFYAGRLPLLHLADPTDGLLDICLFPKVGWSILPRYVVGLAAERLYKPGGTVYLQAGKFTLSSTAPTPLEVDGELAGCLPASFSTVPRVLRIVLP